MERRPGPRRRSRPLLRPMQVEGYRPLPLCRVPCTLKGESQKVLRMTGPSETMNGTPAVEPRWPEVSNAEAGTRCSAKLGDPRGDDGEIGVRRDLLGSEPRLHVAELHPGRDGVDSTSGGSTSIAGDLDSIRRAPSRFRASSPSSPPGTPVKGREQVANDVGSRPRRSRRRSARAWSRSTSMQGRAWFALLVEDPDAREPVVDPLRLRLGHAPRLDCPPERRASEPRRLGDRRLDQALRQRSPPALGVDAVLRRGLVLAGEVRMLGRVPRSAHDDDAGSRVARRGDSPRLTWEDLAAVTAESQARRRRGRFRRPDERNRKRVRDLQKGAKPLWAVLRHHRARAISARRAS